MEQIIINLVAGALGGNAVAKTAPKFDMGMLGNTIAGAVGGGVLGQIVAAVLPTLLSGDLSVGGIVASLVSGGAGGAIVTALIGALRGKAAA
jgi:uncharacterized membrane protein YeaQ/YmgE (transglycosylase-associated protein family)